MNRFIISAAAAAGLVFAAGAGLAPAQAAPLPSGVAQGVIDDQGAVEQARWVRCWRHDAGAAGADTAGAGAAATVGVTATAAGVIMATADTDIFITADTGMGMDMGMDMDTGMAVIIADIGV